jgi:hypothetical protein
MYPEVLEESDIQDTHIHSLTHTLTHTHTHLCKNAQEFLKCVETAVKEGRVMGDASFQDWVDLQWAFMQVGGPALCV